MDDLLAARSQMAMSLAFHIIFAAIGIAMPLLMIIAEWKWLGAALLFPSYYYLFRIFKGGHKEAQKAQ
jgi:cytochrome bd-type quinol oxidase subunit 1